MTKREEIEQVRGVVSDRREPLWGPLENMVGSRAREFMWMFEVEMEDGTPVQAYKHIHTRDYLHLGSDGRSFEFRTFGGVKEPSGYEQVPFLRTLGMVLWRYNQEENRINEPGEGGCLSCPLNCWD
jgi:hypothetical protein